MIRQAVGDSNFSCAWRRQADASSILPYDRPGEAEAGIVLAHGSQVRRLVVERQDLECPPLGVIGNLHFKAEQGGTARAGFVGALLSDMRRSLADLSTVKIWLTGGLDHTRCVKLTQARVNSRDIGNLLGCLTAPANDSLANFRTAQELVQLVERSKGDLANLTGGREALTFYLDELTDSDLIALHNGALGCPAARSAVLQDVAEISHHAMHRAPEMLNQIAKALSQRFVKKVVQEPFGLLVGLLFAISERMRKLDAQKLDARELDAQKLEEPLIRLAQGLEQFKASRKLTAVKADGDPLDIYLRFIPEEQLEILLTLHKSSRLADIQYALERDKNDPENPACLMLGRINDALKREYDFRVQSGLTGKLASAETSASMFSKSKDLHLLNARVETRMRTDGALDETAVTAVRKWVGAQMNQLRDALNNPEGPLNRASLQGLSDAALWYLHSASHLHRLGLELDRQALNEEGLARVRMHVSQFVERKAKEKVRPEALLNRLEAPRLDAARKALRLISEGPERTQAVALLARALAS
ncbi:hypothetical protein [Alcaligenes sp. WGS1538]|uniref:hypothetical protein n=1 Tax=Alcaligenes sp. WGS1538 TaxID=3366811 RepID=UPI00372D86F2